MKISIEVVGGFAHVTDTDTGATITGFDHVTVDVTPDGAAMCCLGFKTFTAHVVAGPGPQAAATPVVAGFSPEGLASRLAARAALRPHDLAGIPAVKPE